jgi:hypothetical protein
VRSIQARLPSQRLSSRWGTLKGEYSCWREVGAQQFVAPPTWRVVGLPFGAGGIPFVLLGASANVSAGAVRAALGVLGTSLA